MSHPNHSSRALFMLSLALLAAAVACQGLPAAAAPSDSPVPLLPTVVPRLQQILSEVIANASSKSGNRSFGQDTERAAAAGFVVRRGTQFFKDGRPFYFVGGNAYWFVDFYTLDWGREKIEEFMDTCQKLGISVLRTWMFNLGMPKDFNSYDARQLAGMDYVVWAAKRRGLMLTLTMGNLWNAYRGPEDFLLWATGSLEGKDILDFYSDPATRKLYKLNIWGLLSRVNPLTGLALKDDPTVFSYNIINEPRCPGCFTPAQQAAHQDWLRDIGSFMRTVAPLHMISAGTEGFFVQDQQTMLHWYNPGGGAQCDGEDWFAISALPYLDYTTVHVYERHMELLPRPSSGNPNWPDWIFCDFPCYAPWFKMYTQLHTYLAAKVLDKPLVIEEFGLTWFKMTPPQQRVVFQVAMDLLVDSAKNNGALAGAMFWNAAHNDTVDWDGYNVAIDRPAYIQSASALPGPKSLPATMVSPEMAKAMTPDNRTMPPPPDVSFSAATAPPALAAQMSITKPPQRKPPSIPAASIPAAANTAAAAAGVTRTATPVPVPAAGAVGTAATGPQGGASAAAATTNTAPAGGAATGPQGGAAAAAATGNTAAPTVPAASASGPAATTAAAATPPQPSTAAAATPLQVPAAQVGAAASTPVVPAVTATAASTAATAGKPATVPIATGRKLMSRMATDSSSTAAAGQTVQVPAVQPLQQQQLQQLYSAAQAFDIAEHLAAPLSPLFSAHGWPTTSSSSGRNHQHGSSSSSIKSSSSSSSSRGGVSAAGPSRSLLVLQDELDPFRRGPLRDQCARESARTWRPYKLFNVTDDITNNPRYTQLLQGGQVVAVISAATAELNRLRNGAAAAPAPPSQPSQQAQQASAAPAGAQTAAAPAAAGQPAAAAGQTMAQQG